MHRFLTEPMAELVYINETPNGWKKRESFLFEIQLSPPNNQIHFKTVKYHPGKFLAAWDDKASLDNEQTAMVIASGSHKVLVKQIAGLIARRIVCYAKPGDVVKTGERYGLIRFGSRTDIFVPKSAEIRVRVGDRVKGTRDVIAVLK